MKDERDFEAVENNIVDALLGAAAFRTEANLREIHIIRDERELFKFKIHALTEDELLRCRKLSTKNRGRRDEETNWNLFTAQAIYMSTVDEDKKLLWQNKEVWQKLGVASGVEVITKVLTPSEKAKIFEAIETISGYDDELDGLIQNL